VIFYDKGVSCDYLNFEGTMVTQFVEGWDFVQTLGEGAYGEYVFVVPVNFLLTVIVYSNSKSLNETSDVQSKLCK